MELRRRSSSYFKHRQGWQALISQLGFFSCPYIALLTLGCLTALTEHKVPDRFLLQEYSCTPVLIQMQSLSYYCIDAIL